MQFLFEGNTDQGLVRSVNQDSYSVDASQGRFFVVADGMGGHAGGEEASRIATQALEDYFTRHWDDAIGSDTLLKDALDHANEQIMADQYRHPERADMGTTVVLIIYRQGQLWRAHVGDSRLYRLRGETLEQITADHTWVGRAIRDGQMTQEQAKVHPWRHVLSQCLGRQDLAEMDIEPLDVASGDRFLLCSDGLTEEVGDRLIESVLAAGDDRKTITQTLIDEAKKAGGSDNITVVLVEAVAS